MRLANIHNSARPAPAAPGQTGFQSTHSVNFSKCEGGQIRCVDGDIRFSEQMRTLGPIIFDSFRCRRHEKPDTCTTMGSCFRHRTRLTEAPRRLRGVWSPSYACKRRHMPDACRAARYCPSSATVFIRHSGLPCGQQVMKPFMLLSDLSLA